MDTNNNNDTKNVSQRAEELGFLIQECYAFEGCYYILDIHTSIVVAGAQDFLAWDEVVRWVREADSPRTLQ